VRCIRLSHPRLIAHDTGSSALLECKPLWNPLGNPHGPSLLASLVPERTYGEDCRTMTWDPFWCGYCSLAPAADEKSLAS
jgi:hypothetical protein